MEVKGTYVKAISKFVETNFPDKYTIWLNNLPPGSKKHYSGAILVGNFYPINEATSVPIEYISKLFYNGDLARAAKDIGIFHADFALKGVYRLFLAVLNPHFLINSGPKLYGRYYTASEYVVIHNKNKKAIIQIRNYPEANLIIETAMESYTKRALELAGGKNVVASKTKSLIKGDDVIEYVYEWE